MTSTENTAELRPIALAFANCFDATTHGLLVHLTVDEEARLRGLLASLGACGLVIPADLAQAQPGLGFQDAIALLRSSLGAPLVDAALAAVGRPSPPPAPPAIAVMLVWPFEPEGEGDDVLVSSARLWGSDLLVEALRVVDDDHPVPVESVRERYDRWATAAGANRPVRATRLPGRESSYAVFAAAAPG